MGLLGGPKGGPEPAAAKSPAAGPLPGDRAGELFAAGVTCLCCEAWGEAYACFAETGRRDAPTLYNMALCCFGVAWYEECHRLVCEAERMLPPDGKPQPKGTLGSAEQGGSPGGELPEPFRRREAADGPPRCPMPGGPQPGTHAAAAPPGRGGSPARPPRGGARHCRTPRQPIRTHRNLDQKIRPMTPLRELYEYYNYPKAATEERRRALLEEIAPDERDEDNGGRTSLHLAAEFADTEAIAQLAARGADIEARDDEGCTPLLRLAMRRGEKSIPGDRIADAGRLLLDLGASLPRSGRGTTALIEAVRNRHHALAAALIDSGQRIDSTDNYGNSALHILCEAAAHTAREIRQTERRIEGFAERWVSDKQRAETQRELEEQQQEAMRCYMTAGLLLDSGAFDPEEKNSCGKTPFAIASEGGAKWVSALLSGQDPFDEATMKTGGMDIFQALRQRDMEALGALLEAGVDLQQECTDPKMYDFEGQMPLVCALRWGQTEAAAMLLRAGADPNVRTSKGTTAFAVLIEEGCRISDGVERFAPLVELFEANGWNPDAGQNKAGERALALACQHDDYPLAMWILQRLLERKVEVDGRDLEGRTPLMRLFGPHSAGPYQSQMQELLLEAGADPCAADNEGRTVLHCVAEGYSPQQAREAAAMLFDFGRPDVSAADNRGRTPLDVAAERNNETLLKFLLKYA